MGKVVVGRKDFCKCGKQKYRTSSMCVKCFARHQRKYPSNTPKPIIQYDKDGKELTRWNSLMEIERTLRKRMAHVRDACIGKRKTAYGFRWSYVE